MAESEYRQKKLLYIYEEIDETFLQIISSAETYLDFLKNSSSNFRLNFEQQLMIYSRLKGAKAVATIEQWNKNGRYVISKAKGIPISDRDHVYSKNSYATVFDISQTSALENAKKVNIWERKVSDDIAIQDMLIQEYNLEYLRENKDVNYTQLIEAGVLQEANEQLGSLNDKYENDDDFIKLIQAVIESTTTVVQARLNLDVNYDFNYITEFDDDIVDDILTISVDTSKVILSKIAKVIQINQSENLMEEYENDRENIRESGRLLDSERDGRQEQELRDREVRIDETRVLGERGQRRDDETNEIGNVAEASSGSEPTNPIESERAGRDYEGSRERDGGNEDSGRPSLGEEDEQHNSQGGRISNSRVRDSETQVESYEEKLERLENEWEDSLFHSNESPDDNEINEYFDEMEDFYEYGDEYAEHMESLGVSPKTLPAEAEQLSFLTLNEVVDIEKSRYKFFTNEEVQGEIRTGSGFRDGKLRIQYQFETCKERKENAEFLKNEYGIGGYGKLNEISSWHDAKGLELNQDKATESIRKELIKWSEVADEIRILIDRNDYLNGDEVSKYNEYKFEREFKKEADETYLEIIEEELIGELDSVPERKNDVEEAAFESIEEEYINEFEKVSERDFSSYVGREIYLDNRKFLIEEFKHDEFHMRDITFAENVGFPIWRVENAELIANRIDELDKTKEESKQAKEKDNGTNYHITDENVGVGAPRERFRNNVEAITALKLCESENRQATAEEQQVLSKYVGWGGLSEAFDENKWGDEYLELHSLLDEQEYKSARSSTLTAFYTPPIVINSIYQTLQNIGFEKGNILEPSCGVGNFIGRKSEELYNSKIYGVELDDVSGRIATLLYPQENISICGFEDTDFDDNFFDVAIGNVPFGDFKVLDKRYDKHNLLIHDYFFAKSLDKVRPGGVVAFITSQGTLDKANSKFRKYLNERAELLGAIRLPDDTFKSAAGTRVTSDIIFLQKREKINYADSNWLNLGTDENGITINQYFIENPQMVLGEMRLESGPFGEQSSCKALPNSKLDELLSDAITNINGKIDNIERAEKQENKDDLEVLQADPNVRNFSYTLVNDKVYYRENSIMLEQKLPQTTLDRIKGMIELRDITRSLISYQLENYPINMIENKQAELNDVYDNYVKLYGYLNNRTNNLSFQQDNSYSLLCSLEEPDDKEEDKYNKAKIFTKRTIKPRQVVDKVDTAVEALTLSIAEKVRIDFEYMTKLCGKNKNELINELKGIIYQIPSYEEDKEYQTADEYLSGNVREKLRVAKHFAHFNEDLQVNVQALEKVQPKDLAVSDVIVNAGVPWIPIEYYDEFMKETFRLSYYSNSKVQYAQINNAWNVQSKSSNDNIEINSTYGTNRVNGLYVYEACLNQVDINIYDYVYEGDKQKQVLNEKETAIARQKQKIIKDKFKEWIWENQERREKLLRIYNDSFNNIRLREFDGNIFKFDDLNNEIELRKHQKDAIARILLSGNTLLAHEVGAGKTFEMVGAIHMSVKLGLANKAMIVVPNHIINQFGGEYLQLCPQANILVASTKDFETKNRKKFISKIATGDYEAVIIGHSQFEKIPLSIERQKIDIKRQLDEILENIVSRKSLNGNDFSVKQLEKVRKQLNIKLQKLNDTKRKDDVINFEELGIDLLCVDEAHNYKNLFTQTRMSNVGGLSQTEAQKSSDMFMKCRYLNEKTNYKGIVFATGTPISNSMVELHVMQRYLQPQTLQEQNLLYFDNWAATFAESVTATELAPDGTSYRTKTRLARFNNIPELSALFGQIADVKMKEDLDLPVPEAEFITVSTQASESQKQKNIELAHRYEIVSNRGVDPSVDNALKITHEGRINGTDPRILDPLAPDVNYSKVNECIKNVFEIWEHKEIDGVINPTQQIFCDLSTPKGDGRFNVYDDIREKLVIMGVPKEDIKFIHEAKTEKEKQKLFDDVNSGKVRILIGSTFKMGSGTNCQKRLYALHHLDCPWRPADIQQRNGRIIRQGNENKSVKVFVYVTKGTFDAFMWQTVEKKQRFITQVMKGNMTSRTCDDIDESVLSYAEVKAIASGNPLFKEKMDLENELHRMKILRNSHLDQVYKLQDYIYKHYPIKLKELLEKSKIYEEDLNIVNDNAIAENTFLMNVQGRMFTEKKEAGETLLISAKGVNTIDVEKKIGHYRGFDMFLSKKMSIDGIGVKNQIKLVAKGSYFLELGNDVFGNIQRIDNMINNAKERMEANSQQITELENNFEKAKIEVEKPFAQEIEYQQKSARLKEIDVMLDLDKKFSTVEIIQNESSDNYIEKETMKKMDNKKIEARINSLEGAFKEVKIIDDSDIKRMTVNYNGCICSAYNNPINNCVYVDDKYAVKGYEFNVNKKDVVIQNEDELLVKMPSNCDFSRFCYYLPTSLITNESSEAITVSCDESFEIELKNDNERKCLHIKDFIQELENEKSKTKEYEIDI